MGKKEEKMENKEECKVIIEEKYKVEKKGAKLEKKLINIKVEKKQK